MNKFFDVEPPVVNQILEETPTLKTKLYQTLTQCDDLRQKQYHGNANTVAGHCYIVSEVLQHILGKDWLSYHIKHEGLPHWFLKHKTTGEILDATKDQFKTPVPYENAKRQPFLTNHLSKRAQELLRRMQ